MEPMNWGVLGASDFARQFMAPAIHMAAGSRLAALATSSPDKAAPFLAFSPETRVFDGYDALLADPAIEAVYIPLPNSLHVEWTLKALAAGKHVLCEKPIAMQAGDFDRLIAARDAAGRLAAEAFMIVHHPQWQRAKALYDAGAIGRLVHVSAAFSYDNSGDPGNIRNRPETGGGALPDIGVYILGSTRFVTGQEPRQLSAAIRWENGVDVFSRVDARFPGFSFDGYVSMRLAPHQRMVFHGDKGVMQLTAPFNPASFGEAQLSLERDGMSITTERWPAANHYVAQVEAFARAARTGGPYACPLEFSRGTQATLDAAFAGATTLD